MSQPASSGNQSLEVAYWNYGPAAESGNKSIAAAFMAAHAGVEVTLTPVSGENWGTYYANVATLMASGKHPDLMVISGEGAQFVHANNLVVPINKYLAFRYGGGAGIGILSGSVKRIDVQCAAGATNANPDPYCVPTQYGGKGVTSPDHPGDPEPDAYSLPPVMPVVNAIIGFQIRPTPKAVINIEGGIRTLPFIGLSAGYFF